MLLTPDSAGQRLYINEFDDNSITVNQQVYCHSFVINQAEIIPWNVSQYTDLNEESLNALSEISADIVLIGTGLMAHRPSPSLLEHLSQWHTAFEFMSTASACRSYLALYNDDRRIAAAFILENNA